AFAGRETLQPAVIAHGDRRPEGTIPPAEADHLVVRRPIREGDPHTGTRTDFSLNNQVLACWALARSRVNFSSDEPRNWCVSSDEPECVEESNLRMKLKDFLEDYNSWCVTQGLQTIGAITLKEELTSRGFDVRESTGHVNWVFGVAPRPDELTLMTQKNRVNDTDLLK